MTAVENVSLVREQSDPRVYLVVGDTKFWITDTAEFAALGFRRERVRVVSDGSLSRFRETLLHAPPIVKASDVNFDACPKKTYKAFFQEYVCNCRSETLLVRHNVLVAGWFREFLDDGRTRLPYFNYNEVNVERPWLEIEDVFLDISLDAVFLDRMYGTNGLSNALVAARWPGLPDAWQMRLATAPAPSGGQPGTRYSSWFLPRYSDNESHNKKSIHVELQAWIERDVPGFDRPGMKHIIGRGPAPAGWRRLPDNSNAWYPFDPRDPGDTGRPLAPGDYLLMRGSLIEDVDHLDPKQPDPNDPWEVTDNRRHDYPEIHPPDWIVRVAPPSRNLRLSASSFGLRTWPTGPEAVGDYTVSPDFEPASPSHYLQVRRAWTELDPNCTDDRSLSHSDWSADQGSAKVTAHFTVAPVDGAPGRYKGAILVGWAERHGRDEVWLDGRSRRYSGRSRVGV